MSDFKVSIFASAVRTSFYKTFLNSLKGTSVRCEVVFAGPNTFEEIRTVFPLSEYFVAEDMVMGLKQTMIPDYNFRYIHTANIKPAQCYEVARRNCCGETIHWSADDCEYTPDCIGKAYRFWKKLNDEKAVLTIQTMENRMFCDMRVHSFFGCQYNTPLMAPLGLMSRKLMDDLGGFDRRYICGQYENDAVMRVIQAGGRVFIWGDSENMIIIDHYRRHGLVRPFASGYNHDRTILESSWTDGNGKVLAEVVTTPSTGKCDVMLQRNDKLEPYEEKDLLIKSQSFNNEKLWV